MAKLKYNDNRPIYIPRLEKYKNGLTPKLGQEIEVTETEKKHLLRMRPNGKTPIFVEVKEARRARREREE